MSYDPSEFMENVSNLSSAQLLIIFNRLFIEMAARLMKAGG